MRKTLVFAVIAALLPLSCGSPVNHDNDETFHAPPHL